VEEIILLQIESTFKSKFNTYLAAIQAKRDPTLALPTVASHDFKVGETVIVDEFPTIKISSPGDSKASDEMMYYPADNLIQKYQFYIDIFIEGDDPRNVLLMLMRYKEAARELIKKYHTWGSKVYGSMISGTSNTNLFRGRVNLNQGARIEMEVFGFDSDTSVFIE